MMCIWLEGGVIMWAVIKPMISAVYELVQEGDCPKAVPGIGACPHFLTSWWVSGEARCAVLSRLGGDLVYAPRATYAAKPSRGSALGPRELEPSV